MLLKIREMIGAQECNGYGVIDFNDAQACVDKLEAILRQIAKSTSIQDCWRLAEEALR